jgi:transposase InsO family protein
MDANQRKRLKWIRLYERLGNAGRVCLKCGISRPTLRKWLRRYQRDGLDGLRDESRRPHSSPAQKVIPEIEALILGIRRKRNLGVKMIRSELLRLHWVSLSLAIIHKVLRRNKVEPLPPYRRRHRTAKRYNRPVPGDRVQMDVCKIAPGLYQYTAIDDCTRYKVLALYSRRKAANSLSFLEKAIEEMPFPIERIQTDRGREFFAYAFQERLLKWGIKFRPIKPRSPHLNGKVERSQRTDLQEFYTTVDLQSEKLADQLQEWQHYYNWERPHSSLGGKSPLDRWSECVEKIPLTEEVCARFDSSKERIREQNYRHDLKLRELKRSM